MSNRDCLSFAVVALFVLTLCEAFARIGGVHG
jgi:hypothetical protein